MAVFDSSKCKRILNLLETGYLRLWDIVAEENLELVSFELVVEVAVVKTLLKSR